jgi:hypothetical protein
MTHRVDTDIEVREDGTFIGKLPESLPAGHHHAIIEFEVYEQTTRKPRPSLVLPRLDFDVPEEEQQFRREDIYSGLYDVTEDV